MQQHILSTVNSSPISQLCHQHYHWFKTRLISCLNTHTYITHIICTRHLSFVLLASYCYAANVAYLFTSYQRHNTANANSIPCHHSHCHPFAFISMPAIWGIINAVQSVAWSRTLSYSCHIGVVAAVLA